MCYSLGGDKQEMRIFKCNEHLKSYTIPIIKIISCALLIIFLINRNHFFLIQHPVWKIVVGIICVQIMILAVLCTYVSVAEMILLSERRSASKADHIALLSSGRDYRIDEVVQLLETNDIIEIAIIARGKVIRLGASSDCHPGDAHFFDKSYYIGSKTEADIKEIRQELKKLADNDVIHMLTIDDIFPDN